MTGIWPDGPFTVLSATLLVSVGLLVVAIVAALILAVAWLLSWPVAALLDRDKPTLTMAEPHPFTATLTEDPRLAEDERWYRW